MVSVTLVVTTTFPQYPGDPRGAFILRHWEQAAARGVSARVLVPRSAWCSGELAGPLDIVRFDYAPAQLSTLTGNFGILENIRDRPWRAALVPALVWSLRRALQRELDRGDVERVVAHMLLPGGWIVAEECARRGVPFELFAHGTDVDVLLWLPKSVRARFSAVIAHAEAVRFPSTEKLARFRRACTVPAGTPCIVEPMLHCVTPPSAPLERKGGAPAPTILYLGRLIPTKGVDDLFAAARRLRPSPRIEVAGDGPHRRRLQRLARRMGVDAVFHGFVHADAKHRLLSHADVVCVPSREAFGLSEGAPLVVAEAFAYGVPVVATSVGGIPELSASGARLLLVPPGDIAALGRALAEALGTGVMQAVPERRAGVG